MTVTDVPDRNEPDRIAELDVLRGLAVFGILVANMAQYFLPSLLSDKPVSIRGDAAADAVSWYLVHVFVDNKFLTLFSLLFGISFALLSTKLSARKSGKRVLLRRFAALFLFGLVHGIFFYYADILLGYAVAAFLLWPMTGTRPRTQFIAGIVLLLVIAGPWRYLVSGQEPGAAEIPNLAAAAKTELAIALDRSEAANENGTAALTFTDPEINEAWHEIAAYRNGPVQVSVAERLEHFVGILVVVLAYVLWRSLGLFMIGAALYRSGWLGSRTAGDWLRLTLWLLPAGVLVNLSVSYFLYQDYLVPGDFTRLLAVADEFAALLLAAGYGCFVFWLVKVRAARWLSARIACVGRTALSNYLGQSVVMSVVATHYGLALFGDLSRAGMIGVAAAFFCLQIAVSGWWMTRFRYGPLEWLWRCFTYWIMLPNRRSAPER